MIRIIPKLEVKGPHLIKGIHLEGLRIVGNPHESAINYYADGADEIIYIDLVASLYRRKYLLDLISKTADQVFIPLTVGGGVKTLADFEMLFRVGADKIAINTGVVANPQLISQVANKFGSQCVVVSIEAQRKGNSWEPFTDCGRTPTGMDAITWAKDVARLGAGEILVTSISQDGTGKGFDTELIQSISSQVGIPVIGSGGGDTLEHFIQAIYQGRADGLAVASALHFKKLTVSQIKKHLLKQKVSVRPVI